MLANQEKRNLFGAGVEQGRLERLVDPRPRVAADEQLLAQRGGQDGTGSSRSGRAGADI